MSTPQQDPVPVEGGERRCVEVLLLLARLIASRPRGTLVHLTTDDSAAPLDLPAWCHLTGHDYLGPLPGTRQPTYAPRTTERARLTCGDAPWRVSAN
jgi:tRNA 2-thiouridine synthesizing protein A